MGWKVVRQVIVSGGGIAGSAAVLALQTAGFAVTVLEARPDGHDGGAVVRVNPNGMDALRAVGVQQQVIGCSFPLVRSERLAPDGTRLYYRIAADPASQRGLPRVLHWSRLAGVLRAEAMARGAQYRHESTVVDVDRGPAGLTAVLSDGSRIDGELLVGADGVRSRVRRMIDPKAQQPQRLGTRTVYGYAADPGCEPPPPEVLRASVGAHAFFAATRDSHTGGCFWFTSLASTTPLCNGGRVDTERLRAELVSLCEDDSPDMATTIERSERVVSFDDYALPYLRQWYDERLIVIGDALHVAPPASEQGAAMAVEDGVILAACLRDHAPGPGGTAEAAFASFERLRRSRVEAIVDLGREGTRNAHSSGIGSMMRNLRDRLRRSLDWQRRPPTGGPAWAYDHHIEWERSTAEPGLPNASDASTWIEEPERGIDDETGAREHPRPSQWG